MRLQQYTCTRDPSRCLRLWTLRTIRQIFIYRRAYRYHLRLVTPSVERRPQTTCLHPVLSFAATIFFQLYLKPLPLLFRGVLWSLSSSVWPCHVWYSTCLAVQSELLLSMTNSVIPNDHSVSRYCGCNWTILVTVSKWQTAIVSLWWLIIIVSRDIIKWLWVFECSL